jgi:hypothetical protein
MEQSYWLERERQSIANARAATLADVRLIHYELADRYSIKAANAGRARRLKRRVGGRSL